MPPYGDREQKNGETEKNRQIDKGRKLARSLDWMPGQVGIISQGGEKRQNLKSAYFRNRNEHSAYEN